MIRLTGNTVPTMLTILILLASIILGCGRPTPNPASDVPPQPVIGARAPVVPTPPRTLTLAPGKSTVGQEVRVSGDGLPSGKSVDLIWETVNGGWVIEQDYFFRGRKFTDARMPLGRFAVSDTGALNGTFRVPEDYGGVHNVVAAIDGAPVAQGPLDVTQSFEMSPAEGPIGTVVEVKAKGLGWRTMENTWVVSWDNQNVGWVSAVETRGASTARFRATGPIGPHEIKLYTGYMGQSYLNHEQAPTAYLPRPLFTFRTTPGGSVADAYAEPYPLQPVLPSESSVGASLQTSPTQGQVNSQVTITGRGLPTGRPLALVWRTMVGSRVAEAGFEPRERQLAMVDVNVMAASRSRSRSPTTSAVVMPCP